MLIRLSLRLVKKISEGSMRYMGRGNSCSTVLLLVGLLSAPALLSIVKQLCVNTYDLIL